MENKEVNIEKIIARIYNCVASMKPNTYTEFRFEDGERYFKFEIMLNDYKFDTDTFKIKLEEFIDEHDEIETINHRLQFYDYEIVNENDLKEIIVIFRVLD